MPLFISNSNYKAKVFAVVGLSLLFYVMANVIAFEYGKTHRAKLENKSIYAEDTQGMFDLMMKKIQKSNERLDAVFVGNSTTKVHIDSAIFNQQNIKMFNYSLLGFSVGQYPSMIKNAIKAKPKVIVISIDKPELYYPIDYFYNSYSHAEINSFNLGYLAKYLIDKEGYLVFSKLFLDYFQQTNYFKNYGYIVVGNINAEFGKFNPEKASKTDGSASLVEGYCTDQNSNSLYRGCNNGDHEMEGNNKLTRAEFGMIVKHSSDSFNYTLASILNGFIVKIKQAGIQPVVIMIPQFSHHVIDDES
jgi:hypothetical protein